MNLSGETFDYGSTKLGGKLLSIIEDYDALKAFSDQSDDRGDESLVCCWKGRTKRRKVEG
jgi:hypothetical protein